MGYSIYVDARTEELQQQMYDFLVENMKNYLVELFDGFDGSTVRLAEGDLSYIDSKHKYPVGFDYGPIFGMERFYITEIVKWLSGKVGDGKTYWYDGVEKTKIKSPSADYLDLLKRECKGYKKNKKLFERSIEFVKNEIKRLDELWEKEEENEKAQTETSS